MCERLKQAVLKTALPERVTGVRIPLPPPFSLEKQLLFWTIRKSTRNARISAGSEPGKGLENERHNLRERLYCRFSPVPGSAVPFGDLRGTRTQTACQKAEAIQSDPGTGEDQARRIWSVCAKARGEART